MSFWTTVRNIALTLLVLGGLVLSLTVFLPKWNEYRRLQLKRVEAQQAVAAENDRLNRLQKNLTRFEQDARFVEMLGHQQGLARTNEVLFRIPADPPPPP